MSRRRTTYKFFCPRVGEHRKNPRRRLRVSRSPDRLRHTALNLKRRRGQRCGHGPHPGGPVGRHVAEAKRPPPERHDTAGVVLPDHFCQGDSGILETPQHGPVKLENLLLLLLGGGHLPSFSATSRWSTRCMTGARTRGCSASRTSPCASRCSS
jgi:hypothetical protein